MDDEDLEEFNELQALQEELQALKQTLGDSYTQVGPARRRRSSPGAGRPPPK